LFFAGLEGLKLTSAVSRSLALLPLLAVVHVIPARAMDVELTFVLPKGAGEVKARFSGFDKNRDGWISSADDEVISAWSSPTGPWKMQSPPSLGLANSDSVDIKFWHPRDSGPGGGYQGDVFQGLARFEIETKSQTNNHVNSNRLTFRGELRFGFFAMHGLSWSDFYNAPSSYSYTFEGPEHQVHLVLSATGSPFLPAVPEPASVLLLSLGLSGMLLHRVRRRRKGALP
jgi:hypothetical protein